MDFFYFGNNREKFCSKKCKLFHNVEKNNEGCWIYTKTSPSRDQGRMRWKMKWYSTQKVAYEEWFGQIPIGKHVSHSCNEPKCINHDHLFLESMIK